MSIRGPGFWGYRWDGYSHQELYDMVKTNAKGPAVIDAADRAWSELVGLMNESRDRIERLQREAGVSWEGRASNAMSESVSPLSSWAQETATAAEQSRASLHQIADGFARTANSMPEPVVVPSRVGQGMPSDFPGVLAGQNDEDAADRQAQRVHQHAIELMNGYTSNNVASADTLGTFAEPPDIGISSGDRTEAGGSAGSFIDSSSFSDSDSGNGSGNGSGDSDSGGRGGGAGDLSDTRRDGGTGGSADPGRFGAPGGDGSSASGFGGNRENGGSPGTVSPDGFGATDPSRVGTPPGGGLPLPTGNSGPTGAPGPTGSNPFPPITGVLNDPTDRFAGNSGRGGTFGGNGSGTPRGFGGGLGSGGGAGGGAGGGGAGGGAGAGQGAAGARGGAVGAGPMSENTGVARGAVPPGARGGGPAAGMGGPMGAPARNEEDKERNSPEYLRDFNDDFWDDTPPVAPPVIGEDDD